MDFVLRSHGSLERFLFGVVGFLFALAFHITPAVALGMGWYSLTGPYLASSGDAVGGAYGLLVNFLRK